MDAVGQYGGIRLDQSRIKAEISGGYTEFQDGDVVVAKITPCFENGKGALVANLINSAAYGTTELHVLRASQRLDKCFLFYLTITDGFRNFGESEMYGAGGQKPVPPQFCKDFPTPLPPISEQTAIADFLDRETGRIDMLVVKKRRLVELLKEKRTALISRTVTRGLPEVAAREFGLEPHTRFKDSGIEWLGEVPEGWEMKRLKFVFPRLYSGVSVNSDNSPADQGSFGVMKTSCVYGNRFTPEENKRVLDDDVNRVACPVTRDSVVISRMNTPDLVGNCGFVEVDYPNLFLPDRLWIARFEKHKKMAGKYAWLLASSDAYVRLTGALATGTSGSMKNLTQEAFLNIVCCIPPLEEQTAITAYLDRETSKIDQLVAKVEAVIARLQEYRTALITAAVTGKIDVRNGRINKEAA